MSWDEKLFGKFLGLTGRIMRSRAQVRPEDGFAVRLDDVKDSLKVLASALTGLAVDVKEAETVGGWRESTLFLPASIALACDRELNRMAYVYRVAFTAALLALESTAEGQRRALTSPEALRRVLPLVSRVRQRLLSDYPSLASVQDQLEQLELRARKARDAGRRREPKREVIEALVRRLLAGENPGGEDIAADLGKTFDQLSGSVPALDALPVFWSAVLAPPAPRATIADTAGGETANEASLPTGKERRGKPKETVEEVRFDKERRDENPVVHVFEKVQTADEYKGGRKALDGEDELDEHIDALDELDLRQVIRSRDRTSSIYKADVALDADVGEIVDTEDATGQAIHYDEWDAKSHAYKEDWCSVYVRTGGHDQLSAAAVREYIDDRLTKHARQVRELRREIEKLQTERRWRSRQPDGPEIDIDAVTDRYATLLSGHSPSEKLYLSRRRHERDFATLVLVDASLSTDGWVQNQRVLDVLKDALLLLGEVGAAFGDRMAAAAFYSNTRRDCRFVELKRFEEQWAATRGRLAALQPAGYTRIGPALRHATHILTKVTARKKLLLLLSDGKPTDYDRYEGRYGMADIRQAVREASAKNVTVKAVAIDPSAKLFLPQMFGRGNFQILAQAERLARVLVETHLCLMHSTR